LLACDRVGDAVRTPLVLLAIALTGLSVVGSGFARVDCSGRPQSLTMRDAVGDTTKDGTRRPAHGHADIRSVTLSRPDGRTLRVVVQTVAPLTVESYVTFRYVAPTGDEEVALTALRGRGSVFIYNGTTTNRTRHMPGQKPAALLNGSRLILNLDLGTANGVYHL